MNKLSALLFLLFLFSNSFAQTDFSFWIQFRDKNHSVYSIDQPWEFLSEKALLRRSRQNIQIKENDLPVSAPYLDSLKQHGFTLINRSKWFNAVTARTNDSTLVNYLTNASFVAGFELVKKSTGKISLNKFANEELFEIDPNTWKDVYGRSFHQLQMVTGEALHNLGFKGQGMTIAVLDAGFLKVDQLEAFKELRNSGRLLGTRDFVDGGKFVYDYSTHGASVLSVMTANLQGKIIGTAPKANYWLLRTEEVAHETLIEEDNWVSGAEFADSVGADIINSSLGYTTFDDPAQNHTYQDMDGNSTRISIGADIAASKGILVVNSAGNSGNGSWRYIGAPADGDSVFAIGAVDSLEQKAGFSSFGPSSDGNIKPNVAGMGQQTILANQSGSISQGNGTSFSSPLIAGMMACLWQANLTKTNMEVIGVVQKTASQAQNPDDSIGYGIPDFSKAFIELMKDNTTPIYSKPNLPILYPNPTSGQFNVMVFPENEQNITVQVFNLAGQLMVKKEQCLIGGFFNNISISDLSSAVTGVYVVRILGFEKEFEERLLKIGVK